MPDGKLTFARVNNHWVPVSPRLPWTTEDVEAALTFRPGVAVTIPEKEDAAKDKKIAASAYQDYTKSQLVGLILNYRNDIDEVTKHFTCLRRMHDYLSDELQAEQRGHLADTAALMERLEEVAAHGQQASAAATALFDLLVIDYEDELWNAGNEE